MTQLRVFDDENVENSTLRNYSNFSESESEENKDSDEKTLKSTIRDKIAKNIVTSLDKVDKRMLKLHGFVKKPHQKTDLIGYLGLKEFLSKNLIKSTPSLSPLDPVTKESLPFDSSKL